MSGKSVINAEGVPNNLLDAIIAAVMAAIEEMKKGKTESYVGKNVVHQQNKEERAKERAVIEEKRNKIYSELLNNHDVNPVYTADGEKTDVIQENNDEQKIKRQLPVIYGGKDADIRSNMLTHQTCEGKSCDNYATCKFRDTYSETHHHMQQDAINRMMVKHSINVKNKIIRATAEGPALLMSIRDHKKTRTYFNNSKAAMKEDKSAGLSPLHRQLKDIADVIAIMSLDDFGVCKKVYLEEDYSKGIQQLLEYARTLDEYTNKEVIKNVNPVINSN